MWYFTFCTGTDSDDITWGSLSDVPELLLKPQNILHKSFSFFKTWEHFSIIYTCWYSLWDFHQWFWPKLLCIETYSQWILFSVLNCQPKKQEWYFCKATFFSKLFLMFRAGKYNYSRLFFIWGWDRNKIFKKKTKKLEHLKPNYL